MEEIGATIPKYQPLRDLWRPLCDYARRTILSRPIRPFTRQLVPSLFEESISRQIHKTYTYVQVLWLDRYIRTYTENIDYLHKFLQYKHR